MRILSARIFSKFFGGKIEKFSTDVTYRNQNLENFKKKRVCILSARRKSKLFGGKIIFLNRCRNKHDKTNSR